MTLYQVNRDFDIQNTRDQHTFTQTIQKNTICTIEGQITSEGKIKVNLDKGPPIMLPAKYFTDQTESVGYGDEREQRESTSYFDIIPRQKPSTISDGGRRTKHTKKRTKKRTRKSKRL
jgi:hypothetical protein